MIKLIQLCLSFSRAVLSDTKVRRQWIFFITLLVLFFVFGGYFLGFELMRRHQILFILYVLASLAGLAVVFLFAIFDLLVVRREFLEERRAARRALARDIQSAVEGKAEKKPDPPAE